MIMTYKTLSLALLMAVLPLSLAHAKDKTDGKSSSIATEKIICNRSFIKADAHEADYKAGVDVNGNPVAPADLAGEPSIFPNFISMPLTIDFADKLQKTLPQGMELKPSMGHLKLYASGKVEFNGQDITKPVALACGVDPSSFTKAHANEDYVAPTPIEKEEPLAGSVAPSSTGPEPHSVIKFPEGAVNITEMPTMEQINNGNKSVDSLNTPQQQ
ncbi:MAG: hypothetical protein AAB276_02190 [Pseudomonadota bacterium]